MGLCQIAKNILETGGITSMTRAIARLFLLLAVAVLTVGMCGAQSPSVKWEELTAGDFLAGIHRAQGVCLLPFGIIEKHGPHMPLGTDLINVRYAALHAAEQEYAVVFPEYYFGQIFEAKHEPGTIAYSAHLQLELLQETTDEMARNDCQKVIIVNGHGGNNHLLPFFAQAQLDHRHDYVVYIYQNRGYPPGRPPLHDKVDSHAGESETAHMMIPRPDLLHQERAKDESGADLNRLHLPDSLYTGIWWYAKFPEHYAGEGAPATKELGEFDMKAWATQIAEAIRAVKADQESLRLQKEFFEKSSHPVDTKQ
jgi:creatinine amidohydrolase